MLALGRKLSQMWKAGDLVLLKGELGAGKTTLVRGILDELGIHEGVRSPTFNLMHLYPTEPPVLHADLYRLSTAANLGLEDYLESHLVLIEWPDREDVPWDTEQAWRIEIDYSEPGRTLTLISPIKP